jgi:Ca-activated chloride channel family protein
MDEFHFIRPLLLLIGVPAFLIAYGLWRHQDRTAEWRQIIDPHLLEHLVVGESVGSRLRPMHLLLATWLICTIALAGPSWRLEPSPFADDEAGLIVLLKVSESMLTSDVQPSRLERAKHKISDLLERRVGSSTGLIVYSGSSHLVMPLTRDDRIVSAMIEDLTPDLMPEEGDALLDALQLAEQVLAESGVPGSALVIADGVTALQAQGLLTADIVLPVQFLYLRPPDATVDTGLLNAANSLKAPVIKMTVDPADVEQVAKRAQTSIQSVAIVGEGSRWLDAGYHFLPLLALLLLMWSRKGWLVR